MPTTRKPMTFSIDTPSPPPAAPPRALPKPAAAPAIERQQVGARVTRDKYRQLKAQAALDGVSVQTLVEQAIDQFLAARAQ